MHEKENNKEEQDHKSLNYCKGSFNAANRFIVLKKTVSLWEVQ